MASAIEMGAEQASEAHARQMDAQYAIQRHIYDLTRKYYLLGRDRLVRNLDVPPRGSVLEVGVGTGRNLAQVAARYKDARLFGLDISAEMLKSADLNIARAGAQTRTMLACADACAFDPQWHFGEAGFDRVYVSYSLSMIPDWEAALAQALGIVAPGGSLHIVDFGQQERLPHWFRTMLRAWLAKFHVTPRKTLFEAALDAAEAVGADVECRALYRGYAWEVVIRR
jgi:S-adenosylmethionine-diacylgycerolhomoserine-N-methlytransferase